MAPNRVILVTGANSGIGYDTSYALAAASANNHVIMGCRSLTKGTKALEELQARKPAGTLSLLELDVSTDESIASAVEKITADHGVLDVLVNNAGIIFPRAESRRAALAETMNVNAFGPLLLAEALLPLLKKSEDPRIINVSSGLGSISERLVPDQFGSDITAENYRMSKAAMNMATACLYMNNRAWGVKVWSFCPGYVVTNLSGEEDRENRVKQGAESSETSAVGILEIVEGKRDAEVGTFIQRRGGRYDW
ncbi:short chain dehydrogenase [Sodiomyces alkalinus F11]|uniref:Short chain dehydrogenase n=1 Tax=Sodiomyces alkalinus (strain CBS 110278 / VKM F-3762 / F11) TaxID=1314773 RepID=A0A3N2PWR1_SODAK|nr:short chain dehydrogenase [Sodiomyces alkalinus F11]ROT38947.1 short chain dehydrogenase [Sodiomyces alkalinus F11]